MVERFQGKAVLMSHEGRDGTAQATGFFGLKKNCRELADSAIADSFRILDKDGGVQTGTSLSIAGFARSKGWQRDVAASILESYFPAVRGQKLRVDVEPDSDLEARGLLEINSETMDQWFDCLLDESERGDDAREALEEARQLHRLYGAPDRKVAESQLSALGHCRLFMRAAEGLPRRVAFVRAPGMLVTKRLKGLIRFSGYAEFIALCSFEDPEGNDLLKRMENPRHDAFEPDRLPKSERTRGRKALKELTSWVREEIRQFVGPRESEAASAAVAVAHLLPDAHAEDQFADSSEAGDSEEGFEDRMLPVQDRPVRRRRPTPLGKV